MLPAFPDSHLNSYWHVSTYKFSHSTVVIMDVKVILVGVERWWGQQKWWWCLLLWWWLGGGCSDVGSSYGDECYCVVVVMVMEMVIASRPWPAWRRWLCGRDLPGYHGVALTCLLDRRHITGSGQPCFTLTSLNCNSFQKDIYEHRPFDYMPKL